MSQYDQPRYAQQPANYQSSQPLSVGEWMLTLFILALPLINLIMLFVWGFSDGSNLDRRNFCRAYLIWMVIVFIISVCGGIAFSGIIAAMIEGASQYSY